MPDTILEGDHPRIISAKFGWDWLSSFRGEDFSIFHLPFCLFLAWRTTGWKSGSLDTFLGVWLQLPQWFLKRRFLYEFPIGFYVKLSSAVRAILVEGPHRRTHFWKRTIQWLFHQILFLLSKWFQTRTFLWEFPIRSYVKLSSAMAAILLAGLKCRTQFWKGTTQGSFQQSLVEIGPGVSEEKIFLNFISLFFYF
jgi:hypothetical protein